MTALVKLHAREVLDSRGRPTVEVEAMTSRGDVGRAIVPSGASTGRHEALELRDRDPKRHGGLGVRKAVGNVVGEIARKVTGLDVDDQLLLDRTLIELDGTPNKSRLGANAILGVSLAVADAAARSRGEELFQHVNRLWRQALGHGQASAPEPALPMPMVNLISGGLHAGRNLDFQDFLMIPVGAASYSQALEMIVDVYRSLGSVLKAHGEEGDLVGDEGGYGPKLGANEVAIERILESVERAGMKPGSDVAIAIDVASTHFFDQDQGTYRLQSEGGKSMTPAELVDRLAGWVATYPIVSIEDGLAEDDWSGWKTLTGRLGSSVQLVGDDFFVTQSSRIERGAVEGAGNAVLIKLNQVGTLSETLDAVKSARVAGFRTVISARSGETEDTFLADLAVGVAGGQIKIGSVARSERLAKYNRLLRIEERLGGKFSGWTA